MWCSHHECRVSLIDLKLAVFTFYTSRETERLEMTKGGQKGLDIKAISRAVERSVG